jgi:hypothetical protein
MLNLITGLSDSRRHFCCRLTYSKYSPIFLPACLPVAEMPVHFHAVKAQELIMYLDVFLLQLTVKR